MESPKEDGYGYVTEAAVAGAYQPRLRLSSFSDNELQILQILQIIQPEQDVEEQTTVTR